VNDITEMTAAKDTVVLVFSLVGITGIAAFPQAMELPPVIPASWFLTKVSSDRPLIPKLGACDL
jgi:hypothetical protein